MTGPLEKEILALSLGKAIQVLEKAGVQVEVLCTGPPGRPAGAGMEPENQRVVRFHLRGNTGILTVAREMISCKL